MCPRVSLENTARFRDTIRMCGYLNVATPVYYDVMSIIMINYGVAFVMFI